MPSVMVVDDDPTFATTVETYLKRAGFEVETAADTIAALEMVETRSFDMLLVDLAMPPGKPSGLSFARMVRYRVPGTRIIFITGYPELAAVAKQLDGKVFTKPADLDAVAFEIVSQLTAAWHNDADYLLERAAQFRKLAAQCEPPLAQQLLAVAADLVLKAEEITRQKPAAPH